LDGRIGVFVQTLPTPMIEIGARVLVRLRGVEVGLEVVSVADVGGEMLALGVYLAPESEADAHTIERYFALRDAVYFER
jgi:hypothetical protein